MTMIFLFAAILLFGRITHEGNLSRDKAAMGFYGFFTLWGVVCFVLEVIR